MKSFLDLVLGLPISTRMESPTEKHNRLERSFRELRDLPPDKPKKNDIGIQILDGFINAVIKDTVKPKVGSVVHCGLAMNQIEHSSIYVGYNKIAHLDGSGKIELVSPRVFLNRLDSLDFAMNIYVSCRDGKAVASQIAAKRAQAKVGETIEYGLISNNCHMFTSGCLTGDFNNKDNFFSCLEETVEKELNMNEWRVWDLT